MPKKPSPRPTTPPLIRAVIGLAALTVLGGCAKNGEPTEPQIIDVPPQPQEPPPQPPQPPQLHTVPPQPAPDPPPQPDMDFGGKVNPPPPQPPQPAPPPQPLPIDTDVDGLINPPAPQPPQPPPQPLPPPDIRELAPQAYEYPQPPQDYHDPREAPQMELKIAPQVYHLPPQPYPQPPQVLKAPQPRPMPEPAAPPQGTLNIEAKRSTTVIIRGPDGVLHAPGTLAAGTYEVVARFSSGAEQIVSVELTDAAWISVVCDAKAETCEAVVR